MPTSPVDVRDHACEHGRIRIVQMHRPDARNAMDTAMLVGLLDALHDADADAGLRGLLLTGDEVVFSAGADVREEHDPVRRMELFAEFYAYLSTFRLPTAAAVEGPAVGGGVEAAGACDVRFASSEATFRFPGAIYGIPVGPVRTIGLVGIGTAKDWVFSARDVSAQEAHDRGFVQRLTEPGRAFAEALAWLELVASRQPETVALQKRMFDNFTGLGDRVAWEKDALRVHAETGQLPADMGLTLPRTVRPRRV